MMANKWKSKDHILPSAANEESKTLRISVNWTFLWAMTKLGMILGFIYICDRTNVFPKHSK